METKSSYELQLLSHIEENPDITQADLATRLGVAVGSVNWYLKRLVKKGYVKVTRMQKRRLRYLLTPEGISEKARLTASFVQASFEWYRKTREASKTWIERIQQAGYNTVSIQGNSDLAEVVYLTCLEYHLHVRHDPDPACPRFRFEGLKVVVDWPSSPDKNHSQKDTCT
jgi:DNA-binding MarR family transcriptional regulator